MKKINKFILAGLLFALATSSFAATKKSIVCTTFPQYDWIVNILGNKAGSFELTLLLNNGTDLHSYQPSVKDIAKNAKISEEEVLLGMGWLFKEGKIKAEEALFTLA